ncbi:BTB domain-containing protein [Mycena chlorophos]|uniref:lytic cellulose monooxygenase (C4-dehydrogenating) n=1 Tax=Mycena chlorophos TaxID=658473 RepID=A0A8H6STK5_MYCCL|nr:BTB domain-containing protein [Mycena chlorophos]
MKAFSALVALATFAAKVSAHYVFPQFIVGGVDSSDWEYNRQTNNYLSNNPVTDVTTEDIRCYTSTQSGTAGATASVAAGSTVGFISGPTDMYHPGVVNVYMAQAPSGTDVADWDGSGDVWFRIFQIPPVLDGGSTITFPSEGMTIVNFEIPSETPSGQYLIRIEQIALHVASTYGGAQFYIACAQVEVTNGGSGTPGPLVAFPGEYTEPGILINIYYPIPTNYTQPGPPLWPSTGGSSTVESTGTTTVKSTSTATSSKETTTIVTTSVTSTAPSSSATAAVENTLNAAGRDGPEPQSGDASPFVCTVSNEYYSQCLPA